MALEVNNLVGGYSSISVLKDISFKVPSNSLVGLIGLNGAGKSTTINHIIGLLKPMKGSIVLNGVSLQEDAGSYKEKIAYIPEIPVLYEELTLKEHIELTMMAYQLDKKVAWEKADRYLKIFRLDNKLDWFPINFSKGMKQKVMIVCALLPDVDLLLVDEPFLGLDPLATRDLLNLLDEEKRAGTAILMSTHVLTTAQEVCDSFVMIDEGQMLASGTLSDLQAQSNQPKSSLSDIYLNMTDK
ncbi:ABC transporter ATP-binding protein [Ligilactobacillus pobuzihii]|uniref:ABC transporter, ATP-binding protein n=1 Tax=Ligilactobacillus pobuzihii TaxID=449659 RepID=A0A0R2L9V2_9LACO|nr:ABC transporter ATP-binding protein [Ligilactobacillus pobuzihii]KRK09586.1 ABC transporter, ATP-binding protein [Ligilactobacillus pobuzihii E100301 = KCTC 13174]KRN96502.1 ABC transporter, ATP-binding protein [Ligilactobacillus pobuzihii]GEN48785.1 ABC transporter ATP-binding protein [Ligilactobacillus pobuzihii]